MSATIVLLCEDRQTDMFVRQFLRRRKFRGRDIKTCEMAIGRGSGEQWVRERFPREVKAIRDRKEAFLVVVIDADTGSTDARRSDEMCHEAQRLREPAPPSLVEACREYRKLKR